MKQGSSKGSRGWLSRQGAHDADMRSASSHLACQSVVGSTCEWDMDTDRNTFSSSVNKSSMSNVRIGMGGVETKMQVVRCLSKATACTQCVMSG